MGVSLERKYAADNKEYLYLPDFVKFCAKGNHDVVLKKIKENYDFRISKDWPIREAVFYGRAAVVETLIEKGVPITTNNGILFKLACAEGHLNIVKLLINKGFDVSTNDFEGYRWAKSKKRKIIVEYLSDLVKEKRFFIKRAEEIKNESH